MVWVPALAVALSTVAAMFVWVRPVRGSRRDLIDAAQRTGDGTGGHRPPVTRSVGALLRRASGRPPDALADRRVGQMVFATVALGAIQPLLAMVGLVGFLVAPVLRRRKLRHRVARELVDELPDVVDLLSLAVSAGLTVPLAVQVVAEHGHGSFAAELGRASRSAHLGSGLADALESLPARLGEPVRPITRILCGSLRDGTSIAVSLERVGAEVRTERRRSAEERARKVSVRLLFPLVSCVLPAFVLLTVVPLLAGVVRGLSL